MRELRRALCADERMRINVSLGSARSTYLNNMRLSSQVRVYTSHLILAAHSVILVKILSLTASPLPVTMLMMASFIALFPRMSTCSGSREDQRGTSGEESARTHMVGAGRSTRVESS